MPEQKHFIPNNNNTPLSEVSSFSVIKTLNSIIKTLNTHAKKRDETKIGIGIQTPLFKECHQTVL